MYLRETERTLLLRIARLSIESFLRHSETDLSFDETPALQEERGVFVTLRIDDELRGCIGHVEARLPLVEAVREVAVKSATEDPRFPPLSLKELDEASIEISVLSPLTRVFDPATVEVGTHGLVIDSGVRRGLLLPGVAIEHHWTREQFLDHTAEKARLPVDIWRKGRASIFSFTTETFSENAFSSVR